MWLYMMAYMITSVVEQAFFVYKSCRVDHGYSEEICSNLNKNESIKAEVQVTVSNFHQWNNIAGHVAPIILALFFGNWSDRRGRKLPLIFGLLGKFIYSFMIVINSMMDTWNLNTVIYTASLPMGMLGGDVAIFGSCFSYISDITSVQQRTLRITILDVVYLSTMPTGVALGSYLYSNVVNSSYTIMFIINTTLLALAIIYSLIRLKWQVLPEQQSLAGINLLTDFFDKKHVIATI
ncbi:Proton-coupled folate transporter, partial [Eufriesea mexicana]